ncbi:MAG: hypothetical protein ABFS08_04195 [Pseudomonadota bacterium]
MQNFHRKATYTLVGGLLLLMSTAASAEVNYNLGLEVGGAKIDVAASDFNDGSLGATAKTDGATYSAGVYGEMVLNRYFRAELGLIDGGFGTMDATSSGGGTFWWAGPVEAEYGLGGIKLGAVGTLPLGANDKFKLLGKVGFVNWASVVNLGDSWGELTETDTGISAYTGIGAEMDVTGMISIRVQHEMFSASAGSDYFVNGYDFDYARTTAGILFRFR